MTDAMFALIVLAAAGLLVVPLGIFVSRLERRAARRRGEPWPADRTPAE
jgi:hypothetical protein